MKDGLAFNYIDLFSGCGGLSLGLHHSGGKLLFAVEKSPMAAETFRHNIIRPEVKATSWPDYLKAPVLTQIADGLVVGDIENFVKLKKVRSTLIGMGVEGAVDLVAGGPPCQGFSLAGRRQGSDARNTLPLRFLDVVKLTNPKVVIMENVLGMNLKFSTQERNSESAYNQIARALSKVGEGYTVQKLMLNAKHYGAPQDRPRLFLIGLRSDLARQKSIFATEDIWKSDFIDVFETLPPLAPRPTVLHSEVRTVAESFSDLSGGDSMNTKFLEEIRDATSWGLSPHSELRNMEPRTHGERATTKFEIYLKLKSMGLSPLILRTGINKNLQSKRELEIAKLDSFEYPLIRTTGEVLAANSADFKALIEAHTTKKHSQRVLNLEGPSPTVITAPDDFIHPVHPRVLTVREMARLQGFPDAFEFKAKATTGGIKRRTEVPQYSQVGNAISPMISKSLGALVSSLVA